MGCAVSRLCLAQPPKLLVVEEPVLQKPSIKLCAPENVCKTFADVGDKVVVYVDFGLSWRPCSLRVANHHGIRKMAASAACFDDDEEQRPDRYRYEIMVAGQITELKLVHPADQSSSSFKAWLRLPDDDYGGYTEGLCIPIRLPYTDQDGKTYKEVSEFDVEQASAVLFQPLWSQLKKHNRDSIVYETMCRSGSILKGVGYGSMDPRQGIPQGGVDEEDALHIASIDAEAARDEERRRLLAPVPLVVLAMLTFFAQFRFQGCYTTDNISVLVPNGAAVLAAIFLVWYIIWGLIQKTPFME
ncbi:predicted protein [Nematostella vectensis]|uniref:Uncharacterized protein n=1 Tax=Nematostella vectensis TaxID=45351 RepID=A7SCF1_NEMVE|nr:predicted protein [Nematostella vectensis]|eukprot:XP_001630655.1 predicted protein [Nematostella vectensis]